MKTLIFLLAVTYSSFSPAEITLRESLFDSVSKEHKGVGYKKARVILFNKLHLEKDENGYYNKDVYCQLKMYRNADDDFETDVIPDHTVVNTEHTWPQSKFTEAFPDETQKADLHHLFPTGAKINSQRGNYPFANVVVTRNTVCPQGKLGKPIGFGEGIFFEPVDEHKGNVARALFYFSVRYQAPIDSLQEVFLRFWHMLDPVDDAEKVRNEEIAKYQKNRNPFIDRPELVLEILDF